MKRNQKLRCSSEIIFIDSTSSCESTQSTITPILSGTQGGAVPIGMLLQRSQSTECYQKGLNLLKTHYPNCFGGKTVCCLVRNFILIFLLTQFKSGMNYFFSQAPEAFMTDDSSAEKGALQNLWPETPQFLCHFHVAQAEWRWLVDGKEDRQKMMREFKEVTIT